MTDLVVGAEGDDTDAPDSERGAVYVLLLADSEGELVPRPTDIILSNSTVCENLAGGTLVGTLSTVEVEPQAVPFQYAISPGSGDTDNTRFTILGNQLLTATPFDYETKSSYSIRVRTTDAGGLWYEREFVITVTDANLVPTDLSLSNASVAENLPAGPFGYALVAGTGDADNGSFTIVADQLQTAAPFADEAKKSYSIRVRTTDQGGQSYEEPLTITILDAPPTATLTPATGQANPTNQKTIRFTAVFSDSVKDFATGDVTLGGTATGKLAAKVTPVGTDGRTYAVAVTGMKGSGTVIAGIGAGGAHDADGNPNLASTASTITYDNTKPTVRSTKRRDRPIRPTPP